MNSDRREYLLRTLWAMCEREDEIEAMRELETYLIATESVVAALRAMDVDREKDAR